MKTKVIIVACMGLLIHSTALIADSNMEQCADNARALMADTKTYKCGNSKVYDIIVKNALEVRDYSNNQDVIECESRCKANAGADDATYDCFWNMNNQKNTFFCFPY